MAKRFFFVCMGILALACAYAVGANHVLAQAGLPSDVATAFVVSPDQFPSTVVVTISGDIFARAGAINGEGNVHWSPVASQWTYMGNCFSGAVGSEKNTLGGVKSTFR